MSEIKQNNNQTKIDENIKNIAEEPKIEKQENNKQKESEQGEKIKETEDLKNKKSVRKIVVLIVLILAIFAVYITQRGNYLEIKEIGENYIPIFWKNFKNMSIVAAINFIVVFSITFITTKRIKQGLKVFFEDEKKPMPKLPHKSISFIISTIVTITTSPVILEKALLCIHNTQFVVTDPVLGLDIGYFVFIWPFLETIIIYALIAIIASTVYGAIYYILVFNICFDGISRETVKKSQISNQALANLKILILVFAAFILLETQNVGVQKFLILNNEDTTNYSLYGAGITETTVRFWGYLLLVPIFIISTFKAIANFKKGNTKKVIKSILVVPIYLVTLLVVMIGFNLIFVNSNELDKEREYIENNIKNTKVAYGIDIDEISVENEATITQSTIDKNEETIFNVPIVNEEMLLKDLSNTQTSKGYYNFVSTTLGIYDIDNESKLVYITPREIVSQNAAYNTKTYEYTHGYGVIISSSSSVLETGNIQHLQTSFEQNDEKIKIKEPRIYFGLLTNNTAVTNSNSKREFDYPTQDAIYNTENIYNGNAGLTAGFLDRLVLAIKESDAKLLFSGNITSESKILTNRNIIKRAKTLMPYLTYDEEPYMVIDSNGELIWVLDAYTTSNNYPYSQRTVLKDNGITKKEINYIRNSVKVLINAYSGEVKFYITDKSDPIAMVYNNMYPELFTEEAIPEDITSHFTYPQYLYNIQAEVLERYHNIQPDVLYRNDDVWDVATHSSTRKITSSKGTEITPYYTMLKTVDSDKSTLGLVLPYTPYGKQNITAYLIGTVDENGNNVLKLYNYDESINVLGPMQLDTQIEQDEKISSQLESLNVTGTKITKDIIIVPLDNTLLYVEPIYQQYVNEKDSLPILKKVVVASSSKVAIGDTYEEALKNLISQSAVDIEIENTDNINELEEQIIKANINLKTSTSTGDWEQIGKDTKKLQSLVDRLEEVKAELDAKKREKDQENNSETNQSDQTANNQI